MLSEVQAFMQQRQREDMAADAIAMAEQPCPRCHCAGERVIVFDQSQAPYRAFAQCKCGFREEF